MGPLLFKLTYLEVPAKVIKVSCFLLTTNPIQSVLQWRAFLSRILTGSWVIPAIGRTSKGESRGLASRVLEQLPDLNGPEQRPGEFMGFCGNGWTEHVCRFAYVNINTE